MERREALGLRSQGGPRAPDQASQPWSESGAHEAGLANPLRGLASPWRLPALHPPFGETEKGTPGAPGAVNLGPMTRAWRILPRKRGRIKAAARSSILT
jgi:hypothetical protein